MMLRPQLAFDADGDGAKHGEAVAGAIIACVRKQLLETMAECGMDGAQAAAPPPLPTTAASPALRLVGSRLPRHTPLSSHTRI